MNNPPMGPGAETGGAVHAADDDANTNASALPPLAGHPPPRESAHCVGAIARSQASLPIPGGSPPKRRSHSPGSLGSLGSLDALPMAVTEAVPGVVSAPSTPTLSRELGSEIAGFSDQAAQWALRSVNLSAAEGATRAVRKIVRAQGNEAPNASLNTFEHGGLDSVCATNTLDAAAAFRRIAAIPSITELDLRDSVIGLPVVRALAASGSFTTLSLSNGHLGDGGMQALGASSTITPLSLSSQIKRISMAHAISLFGNHTATELSLPNADLDGLAINLLTQNPALTSLEVSGNVGMPSEFAEVDLFAIYRLAEHPSISTLASPGGQQICVMTRN